MKRSDILDMPGYFGRYINLVSDVELDEAFQESLDELAAFDWARCEQLGLQAYAEGKWPIPTVLQHLLDWERIFMYRAILFLRETGMPAPGMDEQVLANSSLKNPRPIALLVEEMTALRQSTRLFFKGLTEEELQRAGRVWNDDMTILGIGLTILGHQRHHLRIIEERYWK